MIKEAYCSFEVSKLLKKKGFDGDGEDSECHMFYSEYTEERIMPICEIGLVPDNEEVFFTPTHQMAMAWLREVHNIFIEIGTSIDLNGDYHFKYTILDKECKYVRRGYTFFDWNYEDAVEAALKYVLENLLWQ